MKRARVPRVAAWLAALLLLAVSAPGEEERIDWGVAGREVAMLLSGYIQIDTTNPPGNELEGARYLKRFFDAEGIESRTYVSAPGRGNLVARLPATRQDPQGRGPILLLSHIDVVPADPRAWSFPPLSGAIHEGWVHGRGALDDKGHGAVFALAMALLKRQRVELSRDLVFCASAAEEAGRGIGADWMVDHHLGALGPPSVVWNEGGGAIRNPLAEQGVVNAIATTEKRSLWITLVAEGEGGHGSQPVPESASNRLVRALARLDAYEPPLRTTRTVAGTFERIAASVDFPRSFLMKHVDNPLILRLLRSRLTENRVTNAMVRDTISLTGLSAGLKHNVIPRRAEARLDVRLLPDTDAPGFLAGLRRVLADPRVRIEDVPDPLPPVVAPSASEHELFAAIEAEMERELPGSLTVPSQTTGGTDSSYFRKVGIPSYGFIPALLREELVSAVHGLDERVPIEELERALRVTYRVLRRLAG